MLFTGSSVVISGISIFEAPCTINPKKTCTITFNAHLWFGVGYDTVAALSFYNEDGKSGQVLIIADNDAALCASIDTSHHSGFSISLQICKLLNRWFGRFPNNMLQFRWFPGHMGLEINEMADSLAGTLLPCVNPPIVITTAS